MESRCRGRHWICGDITSGVETWDLPVTSPAGETRSAAVTSLQVGGDMGSTEGLYWDA